MGYTQDLVAHWDLSTDNPLDICWRGNRYPGTGANIVGHPNGIAGGRCAEFNGNNSNVNVGDVVEMNSVEKLSIAFWMNQDILDQLDLFFKKDAGAPDVFQLLTNVPAGDLSLYAAYGASPVSYASFDYSLFISAREWHHLVLVFDGNGATNADRVKMYLDGNLMVLTFTGSSFLTTTPDLSGADLYLGGYTSNSLDGKLDEFMIFNSAITGIQAADLYNRTRQGRF